MPIIPCPLKVLGWPDDHPRSSENWLHNWWIDYDKLTEKGAQQKQIMIVIWFLLHRHLDLEIPQERDLNLQSLARTVS